MKLGLGGLGVVEAAMENAPESSIYDLILDSSDESSIVFNDSLVERQNDVSSNGNNFPQLNVGQQPAFFTNVQNGLSSILYDGVDDRLECVNNFQGAGGYTIFIVCGYTGVESRGSAYLNVGAGVRQCSIIRRNEAVGGYLFDIFIRDSSGNVVRPIVNCPQDVHCLLTVQYDDGVATAAVNNGEAVADINPSFVAESYADGDLPIIGGDVTFPYHGHIDEIRVAKLLDPVVRDIEKTELINKWGL